MPTVSLPEDLSTATKTFSALGTAYKLEPKLLEAALARNWECLEDFRYAFDEEKDITTWIATIKDLQGPGLGSSRMKRAWVAVRRHGTLRGTEKVDQPVRDLEPTPDINELLPV